MNRRNFFKWLGQLLTALPFIALADLEPGFQESEIVPTDDLIKVWNQSPVETPTSFGIDSETIHNISLKDTLILDGKYSRGQLQDFWQQLRELNGHEQGFYYHYILKE